MPGRRYAVFCYCKIEILAFSPHSPIAVLTVIKMVGLDGVLTEGHWEMSYCLKIVAEFELHDIIIYLV